MRLNSIGALRYPSYLQTWADSADGLRLIKNATVRLG